MEGCSANGLAGRRTPDCHMGFGAERSARVLIDFVEGLVLGFVGDGHMAAGNAVTIDVKDTWGVVGWGWRLGRMIVVLCWHWRARVGSLAWRLRGWIGRLCWHGRTRVRWSSMLLRGVLLVVHGVGYSLAEVSNW